MERIAGSHTDEPLAFAVPPGFTVTTGGVAPAIAVDVMGKAMNMNTEQIAKKRNENAPIGSPLDK
jgi:hypothetical protein